MNATALTTTPEPTEAEIQHAAYLIWLESGRQPDRDVENWFAAMEFLRHHHAPGSKGKSVVAPIPPAIPANGGSRSVATRPAK